MWFFMYLRKTAAFVLNSINWLVFTTSFRAFTVQYKPIFKEQWLHFVLKGLIDLYTSQEKISDLRR